MFNLKNSLAAPTPDDPRLAGPGKVGLRLRYARMIQGIPLTKMGKAVNVHNTTIGQWEMGKSPVGGKTSPRQQQTMFARLGDALKVNPEWLRTGHGPMAAKALNTLKDFDLDDVLASLVPGPKRGKKAVRRHHVVPKDETDERLKGKDKLWLRFRFWRAGMKFRVSEAANFLGVSGGGYHHWEIPTGSAGSHKPLDIDLNRHAEKMEICRDWLRNGTLPMKLSEETTDPTKLGPSGMQGPENMGKRIRYAREHFTSYSQNKLGKDLGFGSGACWQWESGNAYPRKGIILELARCLTVTPRWLKHGEGVMQVPRKTEVEPETVTVEPETVTVEEIAEQVTQAQDEKPELSDEESPAAKYFEEAETEAAEKPKSNGDARVIIQGEVSGPIKFIAEQLHRAQQRLEFAEDEVDELTKKLVSTITISP